MKSWKTVGRFAIVMAAVGMLVPSWAKAEAIQGAQQGAVLDVALQNGKLVGQVLDAQGAPIKGELVSVRQGDKVIAQVKTDDLGRYDVRGLKTGIYEVATKAGGASYRVWDAAVAPPAAQPGALMIVGQPVRGQLGGGLLGNPWVLGGIAAAAIIIPLALDDDDPAS